MQTTLKHRLAKGHSGRQRWRTCGIDFDQSPDREGGGAATFWFTFGNADVVSTTLELEESACSHARLCSYAQLRSAASNGSARYYHADLTGSTNALTDTGGAMLTGGTTTNGGPFYYTSFGERVYYDTSSSSWKLGGEFPIGSPRYLYDGGHGYETGLLSLAGANSSLAPITFQHVGERWYQPEIGRFVQRDPIGLGGGLNVYAYCANSPVSLLDSSGLGFWAAVGGALGGAGIGIPIGAGIGSIFGGPGVGSIVGGIVGGIVGAVAGLLDYIQGGYIGKSWEVGNKNGVHGSLGIGLGARDDTGPFVFGYACVVYPMGPGQGYMGPVGVLGGNGGEAGVIGGAGSDGSGGPFGGATPEGPFGGYSGPIFGPHLEGGIYVK